MVSNFYPVWKCSGFQDFLLIEIKLYLKKDDCDLPKQSDILKNEKENH